jgi:hypothetical protein
MQRSPRFGLILLKEPQSQAQAFRRLHLPVTQNVLQVVLPIGYPVFAGIALIAADAPMKVAITMIRNMTT